MASVCVSCTLSQQNTHLHLSAHHMCVYARTSLTKDGGRLNALGAARRTGLRRAYT